MRYLLIGILQIIVVFSYGQSPLTASRGDFSTHLADRLYHLSADTSTLFFSSWKPFDRKEIAELATNVGKNDPYFSYLLRDNWEYVSDFDNTSRKTLFKKLYRSQSDFYHYHNASLSVQASGQQTKCSLETT